ncbi:hypothetical protein [Hymenobacter sp. HDW8]|uniref:hypothetical protein n=1 Tax=Hymenobacter sp. HDW8 TaxID=2714932 RepID=UPI001409BA13|nr:hypothetical protein [Hymenobacter sp. HDW8]QIL76187.1 hypothetical protein G7064_10210 [Hymenobacter sp. HDW8]
MRDYVNPCYLALARQHGFSLHTIEDLSKLLEGQTIMIHGQHYLVIRDWFKLVQKTQEGILK